MIAANLKVNPNTGAIIAPTAELFAAANALVLTSYVGTAIAANNTTARTLTNATISGLTNSLSNIGTAALTLNFVGIAGVAVRLGQSITAPQILESMGTAPGMLVTRKNVGAGGAWSTLDPGGKGFVLKSGGNLGANANLIWALAGEVFQKTASLHGTIAAVGAVLQMPAIYTGDFADERGITLTTSAAAGSINITLMGDPLEDGSTYGTVADAANADIQTFMANIATYINANFSADLTAVSDGSLHIATVATGATATVTVVPAGDPGPDDMDQLSGSDSGANLVGPVSSALLDQSPTSGGRYPVACYLQVLAGTTAEDVLIVQKSSFEDEDSITYVYTPLFRATSGKGVGSYLMLPDTGAPFLSDPITPIPSAPESDMLNPLLVFVGSDGTGDLGTGVEVTVTAFIARA